MKKWSRLLLLSTLALASTAGVREGAVALPAGTMALRRAAMAERLGVTRERTGGSLLHFTRIA